MQTSNSWQNQEPKKNYNLSLSQIMARSFKHIDLSNVSNDNVDILRSRIRTAALKHVKRSKVIRRPITSELAVIKVLRMTEGIAKQYGAIINSYLPPPPIKDKKNKDRIIQPVAPKIKYRMIKFRKNV